MPDHDMSACFCESDPQECECCCARCLKNRREEIPQTALHGPSEPCNVCVKAFNWLVYLDDIDAHDAMPPPCVCPCKRCTEAIVRQQRHFASLKLLRRLEKGGIDPSLLADLLLAKITNMVDSRVEWLVQEAVARAVREAFEGLTLQTKVTHYSTDKERRR